MNLPDRRTVSIGIIVLLAVVLGFAVFGVIIPQIQKESCMRERNANREVVRAMAASTKQADAEEEKVWDAVNNDPKLSEKEKDALRTELAARWSERRAVMKKAVNELLPPAKEVRK